MFSLMFEVWGLRLYSLLVQVPLELNFKHQTSNRFNHTPYALGVLHDLSIPF